MRMLKCYLANDRHGRYVTADAVRVGGVQTCISCGCLLVLQADTHGKAPWFEHDQQSVPLERLMHCAHLDPQAKAEARRAQLHKVVGGLPRLVAVRSWFCVLCQNAYQGEKHCVACDTGMYSIKASDLRENDTLSPLKVLPVRWAH